MFFDLQKSGKMGTRSRSFPLRLFCIKIKSTVVLRSCLFGMLFMPCRVIKALYLAQFPKHFINAGRSDFCTDPSQLSFVLMISSRQIG